MIVVPSRTADSTASRWVERFTRTEVALVDHQERFVVSVPEAAEMLGISRTLAYDLVARKELPSVRFGNRIYVPRDAVALLVGVGDEGPDVAGRAGAGARGAERPVGRRTEAGDTRPASAAPPELIRPRPS